MSVCSKRRLRHREHQEAEGLEFAGAGNRAAVDRRTQGRSDNPFESQSDLAWKSAYIATWTDAPGAPPTIEGIATNLLRVREGRDCGVSPDVALGPPHRVRWFRDGVELPQTTHAAPVRGPAVYNGSSLQVRGAQRADAGDYTFVVENACGQTAGDAPVRVEVFCLADMDLDRRVTPLDIFTYLDLWARGASDARMDSDYDVDVADVLEFIGAYFADCRGPR